MTTAAPVVDTGSADEPPEEGIGLCLSGGGYRAMLFHVGSLWRLHEVGLLKQIKRISSVSGGSITAAKLGLAWDEIGSGGDVAGFIEHVVKPIRSLASRTLDAPSIITGILLPGTIGKYLADAYDKHLFKGATLQGLPHEPRFVINATNLETATLFRFSKPYARDYRVGEIRQPTFRLADAVAASSAFPPVLSPFLLDVEPSDFSIAEPDVSDKFRQEISLTDGGVYDNLGLETVWKNYKTVLVSDGGGRIADDASPPGDWAGGAKRVLDVVDHQVRNLRKRQLQGSLTDGARDGAYWGIRSNIAKFRLPVTLPCPADRTLRLAETPTRLKKLDDLLQQRLINWGYAVCDAGLRAHVDPAISAPGAFPYPEAGVG